MNEKNGGGYREVEKELIEESIKAYQARKAQAETIFDTVDEDPRVTATFREAARVGFSMAEGQYYDANK